MSLKPLRLYGHAFAPNPWKVVTILGELSLPYEMTEVEFKDTKQPSYVAVNPNGRLPAIEDPNTGITLWESGAIILYLCERYDKDHRISFVDDRLRYQAWQWLMFQMSGQGPPTGQAVWFFRFHPDKVQSVLDRYVDETVRVYTVLDAVLAQSESGWLVGDKCSYADLAFASWAFIGMNLMKDIAQEKRLGELSSVQKWLGRLEERPSVQKVYAAMGGGLARGRF